LQSPASVLVSMTTATPSSGFNATVIASGNLPEPVQAIMNSTGFKEGTGFGSNLDVFKIVVLKVIFEPGGTSGWHQHDGPAWVVINSGNLTFYDESCIPQVSQAPIASFESGEIHKAVNEGSNPVEVYATFMLPKEGEILVDAPDPGTCPS
jgi:quercetin dioxygenase-like cupin family protein